MRTGHAHPSPTPIHTYALPPPRTSSKLPCPAHTPPLLQPTSPALISLCLDSHTHSTLTRQATEALDKARALYKDERRGLALRELETVDLEAASLQERQLVLYNMTCCHTSSGDLESAKICLRRCAVRVHSTLFSVGPPAAATLPNEPTHSAEQRHRALHCLRRPIRSVASSIATFIQHCSPWGPFPSPSLETGAGRRWKCSSFRWWEGAGHVHCGAHISRGVKYSIAS